MANGEQATRKKIFSLSEASGLLPEVRRLTQDAYDQVEALRARSQANGEREALQAEADAVVQAWVNGVRALGLEVKGLWLVDFDNGSGYYCWRYPEERIEYYHSYEEGFRGRMRIH